MKKVEKKLVLIGIRRKGENGFTLQALAKKKMDCRNSERINRSPMPALAG
jgi:hypothetical protein